MEFSGNTKKRNLKLKKLQIEKDVVRLREKRCKLVVVVEQLEESEKRRGPRGLTNSME